MTTETHGGIEYHVVPAKDCRSVAGQLLCALQPNEFVKVCLESKCSALDRSPVIFLTPKQFAQWVAMRMKS